MTTYERIESYLNEQFDNVKIKHTMHKLSVRQAIEWWEKNLISPYLPDENQRIFTGSDVDVNGVKCRITRHNFSGAPYFLAFFEVRPHAAGEDAGSGPGHMHRIEF